VARRRRARQRAVVVHRQVLGGQHVDGHAGEAKVGGAGDLGSQHLAELLLRPVARPEAGVHHVGHGAHHRLGQRQGRVGEGADGVDAARRLEAGQVGAVVGEGLVHVGQQVGGAAGRRGARPISTHRSTRGARSALLEEARGTHYLIASCLPCAQQFRKWRSCHGAHPVAQPVPQARRKGGAAGEIAPRHRHPKLGLHPGHRRGGLLFIPSAPLSPKLGIAQFSKDRLLTTLNVEFCTYKSTIAFVSTSIT